MCAKSWPLLSTPLLSDFGEYPKLCIDPSRTLKIGSPFFGRVRVSGSCVPIPRNLSKTDLLEADSCLTIDGVVLCGELEVAERGTSVFRVWPLMARSVTTWVWLRRMWLNFVTRLGCGCEEFWNDVSAFKEEVRLLD